MKENLNPRMHSAEHLLNQTMIRFYNCGRCFSAHIEKKKSKCDYRFDHALTEDEVKKIENQVNKLVRANLPVTETFLSQTEAEAKFNLDRIHKDVVSDKIRIIEIGDYDAVPCIGPHVTTTGEIGQFKIISSDYNNGILRIRYKLK